MLIAAYNTYSLIFNAEPTSFRAFGRVLIARRAPDEKLAGFWQFPVGKVDAD
jgi:8-oxo-dGTP pyrophosphatase MutT (NUDIX family)